jgi:hypothetical protein
MRHRRAEENYIRYICFVPNISTHQFMLSCRIFLCPLVAFSTEISLQNLRMPSNSQHLYSYNTQRTAQQFNNPTQHTNTARWIQRVTSGTKLLQVGPQGLGKRQHRKYMCYVILRRVRVTVVAVEKQQVLHVLSVGLYS